MAAVRPLLPPGGNILLWFFHLHSTTSRATQDPLLHQALWLLYHKLTSLSLSNLSSLSAPHQDYWWEHSESRHSVQGSTDAIAKCTLPSKLTVCFEKENLALPSHAQKRLTNSLPTQAETRNNNKRFRLSSMFSLSLGSTIKLCLPQWFLQPLKVKDKSYPSY